MPMKNVISIVLAVFLLFVASATSKAQVDTSEIEKCCNKEVLNAEDLKVIDDFVADAVDKLVKTTDFASISRIRSDILNYSESNTSTAQAQYALRFSKAAYENLSKALKEAGAIKSEQRRYKVILNLLILIEQLEDIRLTDLAAQRIQSDNEIISYWAVRCVSNPTIIEEFNSANPDNLTLAKEIVQKLDEISTEASPETLAVIVEFARGINIEWGQKLLLKVAKIRMSRYANWSVKREILDAKVLKALYEELSEDNENKAEIAPHFAQLFSYTIKRYIKGRDYLLDEQRRYLASVLVETERNCVSNMFRPQVTIKNALENDSYINLLQEHNRLLGDETRQGEIPRKYNFHYGPESGGGKSTAPPSLPEPPKK